VITLVLVYCLSSDPTSCVEKTPVVQGMNSPMACMMAAQPLAAEYLEEHPAYKLTTFRCKISNKPERSA
jgi:hypothetical protein